MVYVMTGNKLKFFIFTYGSLLSSSDSWVLASSEALDLTLQLPWKSTCAAQQKWPAVTDRTTGGCWCLRVTVWIPRPSAPGLWQVPWGLVRGWQISEPTDSSNSVTKVQCLNHKTSAVNINLTSGIIW